MDEKARNQCSVCEMAFQSTRLLLSHLNATGHYIDYLLAHATEDDDDINFHS